MEDILNKRGGGLYSVIVEGSKDGRHYIGRLEESDFSMIHLSPYQNVSNLSRSNVVLAITKLEEKCSDCIIIEEGIYLGKGNIRIEPLERLSERLKDKS